MDQHKTDVRCRNCKHIFIVEQNSFKRSKEDIEEVGFICPECGFETIAYKTSSEIRKIQEDLWRERSKANAKMRKNKDLSPDIAEVKVHILREKLNRKMAKLNGKTE